MYPQLLTVLYCGLGFKMDQWGLSWLRIQVQLSFEKEKQETGSVWLNGNLPMRQMEEKIKRGVREKGME